MAIPASRKLTSEEIREITSLDKEEITLDYMRNIFGCKYGESAPRFNTYDTFTLPAGRLYNKTAVETTVGKFITNLVVIPKIYHEKFGYVNDTLNKKNLSKIEERMGDMILNDEMTTKEYAEYLDRGEWLGMGCAYFLVPTMNYDINVPIKEVIDKRDELFEKYKEDIRRGESAAAAVIEKEVLDLARKKIKEKGNEAFDFFESGVGKFENNYKKTSIMAGAIENPYTRKLDIMKSNYIDGVDIKEYPKFTNLTIIGGYSRGVATQVAGFQAKKIRTALQGVVVDEKDTDCGTKHTLKLTINEKLKNLFLNRYVVDSSGKLTLLTSKNIDQYVGKEIRMRSPMYCKGDCICNKCAGELFYKMNVKNAGLLNDAMSGCLMNASMKKFHDATVKFTETDIEKFTIKR